MTTTPKARRWFQFRLRTLFVLMFLVCIPMSWIAVQRQRTGKERAAVAAIERLGGGVSWAFVNFPEESRWRALLRKVLGERFPIRPDFIEISNVAATKHLTKLTHIPNLTLIGGQISDAGLENLKGLTHLQGLYFVDTPQVTGDGLGYLNELTQLTTLGLGGTQITDTCLEHLKGMSRLQSLYLNGTQLTDAGLAHLRELAQLQSLDLSGTQVTDGGLDHLKDLSQLTELRLENTQVTDSGVKKLQQALPNCQIIR